MHHHKSVFYPMRTKGGHGKKAYGHGSHHCNHRRGSLQKEGHRNHHKSDFNKLEHALFKYRKGRFYRFKRDFSSTTDPVTDRKSIKDTGLKVSVDLKKCVRCGKCERVCPTGAIKVDKDIFMVDPSRCNGCGRCVEGCPETALFLGNHQEVFIN